MSTAETYPRLLETIDDIRRQWRMNKLIEGALLTVTGVLAVLFVLVATDNLFKLGDAGRWLLSMLLWGTLIVGIMGFIVRRLLEDRLQLTNTHTAQVN